MHRFAHCAQWVVRGATEFRHDDVAVSESVHGATDIIDEKAAVLRVIRVEGEAEESALDVLREHPIRKVEERRVDALPILNDVDGTEALDDVELSRIPRQAGHVDGRRKTVCDGGELELGRFTGTRLAVDGIPGNGLGDSSVRNGTIARGEAGQEVERLVVAGRE
jgi:hypothetical protein